MGTETMADIHPLSVPLDTNGAIQLLAVLSGALAEGIDLGPRGPHIRALALSLDTLLASLRHEVVSILAQAYWDGLGRQETLAACVDLIWHVETLIGRARAYPY